MKLCFATNNSNKLNEIQSLLGDQFTLLTLKEIGCETDIPEPFDTIAENSKAKADYVWENYGLNCFGDDTGLEVFALDGEPGVKSARYAGQHRSSDDNMNLLIDKLSTIHDRRARFLTVITLIVAGKTFQFEGSVSGSIIHEKRGNGGFGYDSIFVPDGHTTTFAEMTLNEKNKLSHRARAFAKLIDFLKN